MQHYWSVAVDEMYADALLGILDRIRDLDRVEEADLECSRGGIIGNASSVASEANQLAFIAVLVANVACNEANQYTSWLIDAMPT